MKIIYKDKVSEDVMDRLRGEIEILKELDHPNIVRLFEVYETAGAIYLVREEERRGYGQKESFASTLLLLMIMAIHSLTY